MMKSDNSMTKKTVKHNKLICPKCNAKLGASTIILDSNNEEEISIQPGDVTLCSECSAILIYHSKNNIKITHLEEITTDIWNELNEDDRQVILEIQNTIRLSNILKSANNGDI